MQKLLLSIAVSLVLTLVQEQTFAQDLDRYTKVANHLVQLMNKENYSGIQTLFSKEMSQALPLEKSTAFFQGVEQQFGKIQKLDPPRTPPPTVLFTAHLDHGLLDLQLSLNDRDQIARSEEHT